MIKKLLFLLLFVSVFGHAQQLQSIAYQNWENSNWEDWMRQQLNYDTDGNVVSYIYQVWDEATLSWNNSSQTIATNNISGQPVQYLTQSWDADSNSWINNSRWMYSYTNFGKVQQQSFDFWELDHWTALSKIDYTYDGNQLLTFQLDQNWDVDASNWVNDLQTTYTNDANGNALESVSQNWNGSLWINAQKITNTYDTTNKVLTELVQYWTGAMVWENLIRSFYTYDVNGFLTHNLFQTWSSIPQSWVNNIQHNYTNNADGTISEFASQTWTNETWVNYQRAIYTYSTLAIAEMTTPTIGFAPNPATDVLEIVTNNSNLATVQILDLNGKVVKPETFFTNTTALQISDLPIGMYVVVYQQANQKVTHQFLKK